jgi:hypothetical protein
MISDLMRRGMEGRNPKQAPLAEDLDDIATLINLLELRARLRSVTNYLENELD